MPAAVTTACLHTHRRSRYSVRRLVNRRPAARLTSSGVNQVSVAGISCSPRAIHRVVTSAAPVTASRYLQIDGRE